ncbi:hypothetical protein FAGAP_1055 [Fusarium agapanthi]|uniref:Uncharacterized protein n=1 Tax=Fusarium agapanthi TaxID=1803897 RepID=A0A9P5EGU9_9HYPO|nr:hypothetical protein FAGAP_1055 [Fusarium agapanthi]
MDVGNHRLIYDTTALDESHRAHAAVLRHLMTMTHSRAQGHFASTVLVDDEHGGATHLIACAETDPLVFNGGLDTDEQVAGVG